MAKEKKSLTTASGASVDDDQNTITAGARGPAMMQDVHLMEKLAHFNRERIPERVVHAKGAGAYGHFECTAEMTKLTIISTAKDRFLKSPSASPSTNRFAAPATGGVFGSRNQQKIP